MRGGSSANLARSSGAGEGRAVERIVVGHLYPGYLNIYADRGNIAGASRVTEANRLEAQAAITKFSGLSAYLANYQDVSARVRYAELTRALNGIMDVARTTPLTDLDRVFGPADKIFSSLNDDCVKTSSALRN